MATVKLPRSNAPVEMSQWVQAIESLVLDNARRLDQLEQNTLSQSKSTTATFQAQGAQIAGLETAQQGLATAQSALASQQTALATAQTDLATAQGTANDAITRLQSNADAKTVIASIIGGALIGANQVAATLTFTKPAWANRAIVLAISVVTTNTVNQTTGPLSGTARTVIGSTATAGYSIETTANNVFTTKAIPLNLTQAVTGDIVVQTQVTTSGGGTANALSAQLAATVFWLA